MILKRRDIFSTGAVAKILGVSSHTIQSWVDSGKLVGHRIPGGQRQRRILRRSLAEFVRQNNFRVADPKALSEPTVITLGVGKRLQHALDAIAPGARHYSTGFALARDLGELAVVAAVLDVSAGISETLEVCRGLQNEPYIPQVIVLDDEIDDSEIRLISAGADLVLRKPVDAAALAERVQELLAEALA